MASRRLLFWPLRILRRDAAAPRADMPWWARGSASGRSLDLDMIVGSPAKAAATAAAAGTSAVVGAAVDLGKLARRGPVSVLSRRSAPCLEYAPSSPEAKFYTTIDDICRWGRDHWDQAITI